MARKRIKITKSMLLLWFMLAALILLFSPQKLTSKFQFAFARIFDWPLRISRGISLSAQTQQQVTDVVSRREYNKLQNHIANLNKWLQEKHKQIAKLSGLRTRDVLQGANFVLADIISSAIDGSTGKLFINRGSEDGLQQGQFVLGDNSIIGIIAELSSRTAQVKLATDPTSKIQVKIASVDIDGILQGRGNNTATIELLQTKYKINVGDFIFAQKAGFLDNQMVIGKITNYKRDDEKPLLWDVTIELACNIEKLSSVTVIIMNPNQ